VKEFDPPHWSFEDYREKEFDELAEWEQVIQLDSEITDNELLGRYLGAVGPNEWPKLEAYYSKRFSEFVNLIARSRITNYWGDTSVLLGLMNGQN